jgi:hypothetical protein
VITKKNAGNRRQRDGFSIVLMLCQIAPTFWFSG